MIVSLHLADLDPRGVFTVLRTAPRPAATPGLRYAAAMLTAPLSGALLSRVDLGRVGLLAFWETEDALDRFLGADPVAARLAGGWQARWEPVRAVGDWPGLADEPAHGRVDGPAAAVTLGRLRASRTLPFLRASAAAEDQALRTPGFLWGTAMARPPLVSTCSLWRDSAALAGYARRQGHAAAVASNAQRPFHRRSVFLRLRPLQVTGRLDGANPLPADRPAPGPDGSGPDGPAVPAARS